MTAAFTSRLLFGVLFLSGMGYMVVSVLSAEHTKDSLDTVKKAVAKDEAVLLDVREKA